MSTVAFTGNPQSLANGTGHTVLVVEDEWMVRMPISEYLRDCGYTVLEAADAPEALAVINGDHAVDLVFSDIRMPGTMDGLGLAVWLRSHRPDVPVILTSGYTGGRSPDSIPGVRFIEKPYSQAQVEKRIAALLDDDQGHGGPGRPATAA